MRRLRDKNKIAERENRKSVGQALFERKWLMEDTNTPLK